MYKWCLDNANNPFFQSQFDCNSLFDLREDFFCALVVALYIIFNEMKDFIFWYFCKDHVNDMLIEHPITLAYHEINVRGGSIP